MPDAACGADELRDRYEELRRQVLGARSGEPTVGLGVLVRQGMAAWMTVVSGIADQPVTAPLAQQPPRSDMPRAVKDEVVVLLAGMALGSMQGVTA